MVLLSDSMHTIVKTHSKFEFTWTVPKFSSSSKLGSATEELWSEYDFVVNQRRTRLLKGRAEKLVRVHANARVARRMRGLNYSEDYIPQSDSCSEGYDSEFEF